MLAVSASASADTGLKKNNRLADHQKQITEAQVLCEESGVQTVMVRDETGEITIACDKLAPESAPAPAGLGRC